METDRKRRVLLITGKGGVGKTVVAAATALQASRLGRRTLVISADPAHSLGDSFDMELEPEPKEVLPGLWAQESNVLYNTKKHWARIQRWLAAVFMEHQRGLERIEAEEVAILPGFDELSSLIWIAEHYKSGAYDLIVVDCAPTAETLRLLSTPEVGQWWVRRWLRPLSKASEAPAILRLGAEMVADFPLPTEEVVDDFYDLFTQIKEIQTLVSDPRITSVRLVLNPEKMVVRETQRAYTYFSFFGYTVDAIICNKVIPDDLEGDYWQDLIRTQRKYLKLIEESFSPLPILKIPLLKDEVVGVEALGRLAELLYDERDPAEPLIEESTFVVEEEKDSGDYLLKLKLPFVSREDLKPIWKVKKEEELIVQVKNWKRNILLPLELQGKEVVKATLRDQWLTIRFRGR